MMPPALALVAAPALNLHAKCLRRRVFSQEKCLANALPIQQDACEVQ